LTALGLEPFAVSNLTDSGKHANIPQLLQSKHLSRRCAAHAGVEATAVAVAILATRSPLA
jgi:hypothetical protein